MISTIQLRENVKQELAGLKEKENDSYEDVIVRLVNVTKLQNRQKKELLIEGYIEMAEESLKICKEFDTIEEDFDWEWK
ncbi:MAG: hypothetical protein AABX11_04615 [Nanoarchaeota archaeon]